MSRAYISPEKPCLQASFRFLLGFMRVFLELAAREIGEDFYRLWYFARRRNIVVVRVQLAAGHPRTDNRSTRDGTEVLCLRRRVFGWLIPAVENPKLSVCPNAGVRLLKRRPLSC